MGDASKEIEKQLMDTYDLKADVIKIGHHGSNTSSDAAFLDSLDCKIALISAGYKNKYDHPSTETLKTLDYLNIHTFCTSTMVVLRFILCMTLLLLSQTMDCLV